MSAARAMGRVVLVGAGPGDPELLTLRGARALEEADLVLYDALVDPRVLQLAPRAQRFFVGKRAARPSIAQSSARCSGFTAQHCHTRPLPSTSHSSGERM